MDLMSPARPKLFPHKGLQRNQLNTLSIPSPAFWFILRGETSAFLQNSSGGVRMLEGTEIQIALPQREILAVCVPL